MVPRATYTFFLVCQSVNGLLRWEKVKYHTEWLLSLGVLIIKRLVTVKSIKWVRIITVFIMHGVKR